MSATRNYIKEKEEFINATNEMIGFFGDPKKVAEILDNLIFENIEHQCEMKSCCDNTLSDQIYVLRELRNIFAKS